MKTPLTRAKGTATLTALLGCWLACTTVAAQPLKPDSASAGHPVQTAYTAPHNGLLAVVYPLSQGNCKFRVHLANPSREQTILIVRNARGEVLHQSLHTEPAYSKVFSLSEVEDGLYTFELRNHRHQYTRTFRIGTSTLREVIPHEERLPASVAANKSPLKR